MHLDTEDSQRLLEELGRFSRERIAHLAARPHRPIDGRQPVSYTHLTLPTIYSV